MQEINQSRGRWSYGSGKGKLMRLLKNRKKVIVRDTDGLAAYERIKPQEHGIKKALLERPLVADTSVILQRLVVEILHTSTQENVKELILTAMKKIKWETELFTKQLERHIVEAEMQETVEQKESESA
ncbi:hypothetical protein [Nostoc sp. NMS4]|uniref:hypothetical protein n=1 Tax=Nostoc sp. NMS4 TaxID=2815390 RepID=UPI0025DBE13E|nr:hypothetical protein [Nostoc sp. NMS4]MBN3924619.1 hypothetical protein [Nostoc sp. NMS4]